MTGSWEGKVESAVARIREYSRVSVRGCSSEELLEFQRQQKLTLPAAYLSFLLSIGQNPGEFLVGSDLSFSKLVRLQSGAQALLRDDGGPALPPRCFVFCSHQGYQFLFFKLDEGADPAVHYYLEGAHRFREVASSFSEWLERTVREEFPPPDGSPAS